MLDEGRPGPSRRARRVHDIGQIGRRGRLGKVLRFARAAAGLVIHAKQRDRSGRTAAQALLRQDCLGLRVLA